MQRIRDRHRAARTEMAAGRKLALLGFPAAPQDLFINCITQFLGKDEDLFVIRLFKNRFCDLPPGPVHSLSTVIVCPWIVRSAMDGSVIVRALIVRAVMVRHPQPH